MGLLLGALLCGGAALVAGIVKAGLDSLSEQEVEKRDRMSSYYEEYIRGKNEDLEDIYEQGKMTMSEIDSKELKDKEDLKRQYEQKIRENRWKYYEKIEGEINTHIQEKNEELANLKKVKKELKDLRKKSQLTAIRKNSLESYEQTLNETINKYEAYKQYLNKYKYNMRKIADNIKVDLPAPFELILPEKMPYCGKLIFMRKSEIQEFGEIEVSSGIKVDYECQDIGNYMDLDGEIQIPVFVCYYNIDSRRYELSIDKGMLKNTITYTHRVALECKVERCESSRIYLKYKNLDFILDKKNLMNPKRTPPRGSELRVYPLSWDYNLRFSVRVTEKYEQSLKSGNFKEIPVSMEVAQLTELKDYIEENNVEVDYNEWKVGPYDEDFNYNGNLKMQLGSNLILKLSVVVDTDRNSVYLKFIDRLEKDDMLKSEDIFATINATLKCIVNDEFKEFDESNYLNMVDLHDFLEEEFKVQKAMLKNRSGISYFYLWTQVLDAYLRDYSKREENKISCKLDKLTNKKKDRYSSAIMLKYDISNVEDVKERISDTKNDRGYTDYFYETEDGRRIAVELRASGETITFIQDDKTEHVFEGEEIDIYKRDISYPVLQQKMALMNFREGTMKNLKFKEYLLNSENVEYIEEDFKVQEYQNKDILRNDIQREAVERALAEKNFFMIQGPPGTGKTTVIKEIICQYMKRSSRENILVISQTNVAVDNVLERLLRLDEDYFKESNIIRCGRDDVISESVRGVSFQTKYERYIDNIKFTEVKNENNVEFRNKWITDIVENRRAEGILGEIILSHHKIVGATCVGLANRRIGLRDIEFDLVVMDEAGKALPGELMIPILRAKKIVMIGDHKQLPPTIDQKMININTEVEEIEDIEEAKEEIFSKSLFEILYEGCPDTNKCMLDTQFRMPSTIGNLISELFYEGKLKSGDVTYQKKPIYFEKNMNFLDMSNDKGYRLDRASKTGRTNKREAKVVRDLIWSIREKSENKIAVITPYRAQKRELQKILRGFKNVQIDTVDGFQGDEADIAIFATTRSYGKTDFFSDYARINVALSRTIRELIVVGSLKYFRSYGKGHPLYEIAKVIERDGNIVNWGGSNEG